MVEARRLNRKGMEAFGRYLDLLTDDGKLSVPFDLLEDPKTSESLSETVEVDSDLVFENRYQMGLYLVGLLSGTGSQNLLGDRGFWSWLALLWFEQLCPAGGDGKRKPSKEYNYILSENWRHRPRHALYTTWMLVANHGENALFMLSKMPHERGELIEQLAARQYFMACRGVIEAAHKIYYDSDRKTFKKGATSQRRGGNIRRFVSYLQQLDLTYDLGSISANSLLDILPREYDRFAGTRS